MIKGQRVKEHFGWLTSTNHQTVCVDCGTVSQTVFNHQPDFIDFIQLHFTLSH